MSSIGVEYRCVQYKLKMESAITNQWFDLPFYDGKATKPSLFVREIYRKKIIVAMQNEPIEK